MIHLRINAGLLILIGLAALVFAPKIANLAKHVYENELYAAMVPGRRPHSAVIALVEESLRSRICFSQTRPQYSSIGTIGLFCWASSIYRSRPMGQIQLVKFTILTRLKANSKYAYFAVDAMNKLLFRFASSMTILVERIQMKWNSGLGIQPEPWIPKREDFVAKWRAIRRQNGSAVAFVRPEMHQEFIQQQVPMRVI